MDNFKINLFDNKALINSYINNNNRTNIDYYNMEELIFTLCNSKDTDLNIICKVYEKEILTLTQRNTYITPDGYFYSLNDIQGLDGAYNEDIDKDGNIHYTDVSIKDYRELEKEKAGVINNENDIGFYLSDKDTEIYGNIKAEKTYKKIDSIGLKVLGYSGVIEPIRQIDLANGIHKLFIFNINIPNKKEFINKATEYLESKIDIKGYTVQKLKEKLLAKIKGLDEKYGTNGKNILVINDMKYKYFKHTLILLHLESKIQIAKYDSTNKEFEVNILKSKEIVAKSYDVKEGSLIINNGEAIIPLGNLEELIMDRIKYDDEGGVFTSEFASNDPIASIKKIRRKIKDTGITNFIIVTKRNRYSGNTAISIKIT